MDIAHMFPKNACSLDGGGSVAWTWEQYFEKKKELGDKIVLVDMIGHPVPGSIPLSNELLEGKYPKGTIFVFYCHSGGSSGALQKRLTPAYPEYTFINLLGGMGRYPR
jgi:rhodanese-related sulfurtransferase